MTVHFSQEAEECLVGSILLHGSKIMGELRSMITPADFFNMRVSHTFQAMESLHDKGFEINTVTVAEQLRSSNHEWDTALIDLIEWMAGTPTLQNFVDYASIVIEYSIKRKVTQLAAEITDFTAGDFDLDEVLDLAESRLENLERPIVDGFTTISAQDLISEPAPELLWLVPELFTIDSRCIIVAPEGAGKSVLMRQIATAIAMGIHPFRRSATSAHRVLFVDLENPRHVVQDSFSKCFAFMAENENQFNKSTLDLLLKPEGLDLRSRRDLAMLESVLQRHRPEVVFIGPLYKLARRKARETDEEMARDLQDILDDLRTRYSFALIMEHHAPQAQGGVRDLRPYGSSYWLRWPDLGVSFGIDPQDQNRRVMGRWRGHRHTSKWPKSFRVGTASEKRPWVAEW
jgi:replicative DNA helicase